MAGKNVSIEINVNKLNGAICFEKNLNTFCKKVECCPQTISNVRKKGRIRYKTVENIYNIYGIDISKDNIINSINMNPVSDFVETFISLCINNKVEITQEIITGQFGEEDCIRIEVTRTYISGKNFGICESSSGFLCNIDEFRKDPIAVYCEAISMLNKSEKHLRRSNNG